MSKCSNCNLEFKKNVAHVKVADGKCKERMFNPPKGKRD